MIGNDIIDLQLTGRESNWQRPGFLKKLFTSEEKALIQAGTNPETIVWLLWSMKESAYKIVARQEKRSFFAPKKFRCALPELKDASCTLSGSVAYQDCIFKTDSQVTPNHIHTIAWTEGSHLPYQSVIKLQRSDHFYQRHLIYTKLIEQFAGIHRLNRQGLSIQKNELGIPQLLYKNVCLPQVISISHHGYYGSFAFEGRPD